MNSSPSPTAIAADASWLVQAFEESSGLARIVAMTRDDYRAASFLDDRMFGVQRRSAVLPWAELAAAVPAGARADAGWIFHIGHVGSTLVARLLGELDGMLAIREPRVLRDVAALAEETRDAMTGPLIALLSRTFDARQRALVKATSFVSEIAPELVGTGPALFLYAAPRAYVASILAGENSVAELRQLEVSRLQRAAGRIGAMPDPRDDAERAAAAWACEMTALAAAAERIGPSHVQWADFDRMLGSMPAALGEACALFGVDADADRLRALGRGPLMARYSKAPEHAYSPQLRRDLIDEASHANRVAIDRAMLMLDTAARSAPLLQRALDRAEG